MVIGNTAASSTLILVIFHPLLHGVRKSTVPFEKDIRGRRRARMPIGTFMSSNLLRPQRSKSILGSFSCAEVRTTAQHIKLCLLNGDRMEAAWRRRVGEGRSLTPKWQRGPGHSCPCFR